MNGLRVAVIVPCFNDGAFIDEALASVAAQEEPCELVVIDDGSTDGQTLALLEAWERAGNRVVHQANQGPAAGRMAGLRATRAPYVVALDADDVLLAGALSAMADALDGDSEARLAWGDVRKFGAAEGPFPQAREIDPWRITYLNELPEACMVRRAALEAVGGWHLELGYEDWDLWLGIAERGWTGVHVGRPILGGRVHAGQRRHQQSRHRHEQIRAIMHRRHAALFAKRRRAWRASPSPWGIKLLFPAIDACPGLSEFRKQQLYYLVRHLFDPDMCADSLSRMVRSGLARKPTPTSEAGRG